MCLVATPAVAQGFTVVTRTSSSAFRARMKAQVYARSRGRQRADRATAWDHDLQRARLELTIDYDRWLRLTIEPDFAGANADLRAHLDAAPVDPVQHEEAARHGAHSPSRFSASRAGGHSGSSSRAAATAAAAASRSPRPMRLPPKSYGGAREVKKVITLYSF